MVLLKHLRNICRTLKTPLINCETNLILTWSTKCVIPSGDAANQATTFGTTDAKLYVPVPTNIKQLYQLMIVQNYYNS